MIVLLKKAPPPPPIVNLPNRLKGNVKCISGNLLSLLGAENKYIVTTLQMLLTGVRLHL